MSALQSKARLRMLNGPGHLYAAYSRYCDWIKIGFTSKSAVERKEGIDHQYAEFSPFSLIGAVPSSWAAEQQLHSWLAPFRQKHKGCTTELYPASYSVVGMVNRILSNPEWEGLEYPASAELRKWCISAAGHVLNRIEADICFERFFAERKQAQAANPNPPLPSFLDRRPRT